MARSKTRLGIGVEEAADDVRRLATGRPAGWQPVRLETDAGVGHRDQLGGRVLDGQVATARDRRAWR